MGKTKEILRAHRIAILLAVLTSLVCALPQVYFRIDHKELYQEGIEAIEMLPDSNWTPRMREVQDGHLDWGSIYYKDGKNDPYIFQPLGSTVVAFTGMLFGLNVNDTILLARIMYPALTFLIMYSFVFLISRDKLAAASSTGAILLAGTLLSPAGIKSFVTEMIHNRGLSSIEFLELSQPVNSAMIFIFLFGFLVTFWLFYRRRSWQWGVLSALLLGLNFYNYFWSWTYLFAFGGILVVSLALQKEWREVRRVTYVFLGALVVAIPFALNLYATLFHPSYEEVGRRVALIASHSPQFIGTTALFAIMVFLLGFPRKDTHRYTFILSLLLTPIVTLNQQIITGKVIQEGHYHWYMHQPIAIMVLVVTIFYVLDTWKMQYYKKLAAVSAILVSFAIGFETQLVAYMNVSGNPEHDGGVVAIERQKYAPVMHWLNQNAVKDSVVFANENVSHVVVIYTPLNVFHHVAAHASLASTDERMLDIIFTYYRLRGIDYENVGKTFYDERALISTRLYGLYYRELEQGGQDDHIPDDVINTIIVKYSKTLSVKTSVWLHEIWKKYEVEYLVWDKKSDPSWNLDQYPFLEKAATFGDIAIYRFVIE